MTTPIVRRLVVSEITMSALTSGDCLVGAYSEVGHEVEKAADRCFARIAACMGAEFDIESMSTCPIVTQGVPGETVSQTFVLVTVIGVKRYSL